MRQYLTFNAIGALLLLSLATTELFAGLPEIEKQELVDMVDFFYPMVENFNVKYTIESKYEPLGKSSNDIKTIKDNKVLAEKTRLDVEYRWDNERYYFDVVYNDTLAPNKPVKCLDAFDGSVHKVLYPKIGKATVVKRPDSDRWTMPTEFGYRVTRNTPALNEFLRESEIRSINKTQWQGHDCYLVEIIRTNGTKSKLWIDPKVGWKFRYAETYTFDNKIAYKISADFEQYSDNIWFPKSGELTGYKNDEQGNRVVSFVRKMKVKEVKINTTFSEDDFQINFPDNTRVFDSVINLSYVVGASSIEGVHMSTLENIVDNLTGQPTVNDEHSSKAETETSVSYERVGGNSNIIKENTVGTLTVSNNNKIFLWILMSVVVFFSLFVFLWFYKRRKS